MAQTCYSNSGFSNAPILKEDVGSGFISQLGLNTTVVTPIPTPHIVINGTTEFVIKRGTGKYISLLR